MTTEAGIARARRDIHTTIESFARTLHDAVEGCETPMGLLLMAKIVAHLVLLLEKMVDSVEVDKDAPQLALRDLS